MPGPRSDYLSPRVQVKVGSPLRARARSIAKANAKANLVNGRPASASYVLNASLAIGLDAIETGGLRVGIDALDSNGEV